MQLESLKIVCAFIVIRIYLRKSVYYHIGDYLGIDSAGNLNEGVCSIFDSVIIV